MLDFEESADLKKEISSLRKKLKGDLKQQTIKISLDLDNKNKVLVRENKELVLENKELLKLNKDLEQENVKLKRGSKVENNDVNGKYKMARKEREEALDKLEEAKKTLDRIKNQRNRAEKKEDESKKEVKSLIKKLREVREDYKKKEGEISALKEVLKSIMEEETDLAEEVGNKSTKEVDEADEVDERNDIRNKPECDGEKGAVDLTMSKINVTVGELKEVSTLTGEAVEDSVEASKGSDSAAEESVATKGSVAAKKSVAGKEGGKDSKENIEDDRENEENGKENAETGKKRVDKDKVDTELIEEWSSGEEWEGTSYFKVGNHLVYNVKNAKDSIAVGAKLPLKIVKETKGFAATSLNNRIIFIATNAKSRSNHNPAKGSSVCGLTPVCTRRWVVGDPIAKVLIIGCDWHPMNETEQWVCTHHQDASLHGNNLQMQKVCKGLLDKREMVKKVIKDPFQGLEDFKGGKPAKGVKK